MGAYELASALLEEGLALDREAGDRRSEGVSLVNLGVTRLYQGDLASARPLLQDGLRAAHEVGYSSVVRITLQTLGHVAVRQGEPTRAGILLGASETLRQENQHYLPPMDQEELEQTLTATRQALGDQFERAFAKGASLSSDQAVAYALDSDLDDAQSFKIDELSHRHYLDAVRVDDRRHAAKL
jgi:non-specific serine/threonine protein kinase